MKKGILVAALASVFGSLSVPVQASTYTYDLSISALIDGTGPAVTITGRILTTCDNCILSSGNITSATFGDSVGATFIATSTNISSVGNLEATPTGLYLYDPGSNTNHTDFYSSSITNSNMDFGNVASGSTNIFFSAGPSAYPYDSAILAGSPMIATIVAPTPLPAALPLFAGGVGVLGLIARRRKRKAA